MSGVPSPETGRFATLDGLRGAAALMVVLFHFQLYVGVRPSHGYLAVDLFFAISGFVLSAAYVERFRAGLKWQEFLDLRVSRFYPLYAVGLAMGLLALAAGLLPSSLGPREISSAVVLGLFMMPSPASQQLFPFNGVAWSLFFELVINLLLACSLWKLRSRYLAGLAALGIIAIIALNRPPDFLNMGWDWSNATGGAARTVFSFCFGMLLYRAVGDRPRRPHNAAAILPLVVLLFALNSAGDPAHWDLALVILVSPLTLVAATLTEVPLWARPVMQWLGALSYALYAVHWPLAILMGKLLKALPIGIAAAVYIGSAVLLAHLLERYFDRPTQSFLKQRRRRTKTAAPGDPFVVPVAQKGR